MSGGGDRKGTFKVEFLKELERKAQEKWEEMKVYEMDAPEQGEGTPGNNLIISYNLIFSDWKGEARRGGVRLPLFKTMHGNRPKSELQQY